MPRAPRRCSQKDCDEYVPCSLHKPVDRRPPSSQRGYDAEYQAALKTPEFLAATHCESCGREFEASGPRRKTGGHRKDIRNGGTTADGIFPQCAHCNYGWRRGSKSKRMRR